MLIDPRSVFLRSNFVGMPVFLKSRTWVDFRSWDPDPLKQLVWGITGERARVK